MEKMKYSSIEKWDNSHDLIQYAPAEVLREDEAREEYTKQVIIPSNATDKKAAIVSALIRERYTVDDELAVQRQRDTKPDEFTEYNTFAEACKAEANRIIGSLEG